MRTLAIQITKKETVKEFFFGKVIPIGGMVLGLFLQYMLIKSF